MKSPLRLPDPNLKRFGKYGLVGISSYIVGLAVFNLVYFKFTNRAIIPATAISYFLSVCNGFILNRQWTFKEKRGESGWVQWGKFLTVNSIGYVLNTVILVSLLALYTHVMYSSLSVNVWQIAVRLISKTGGLHYSFLVINSLGVLTTIIVTIWNFLSNRAWTFRH